MNVIALESCINWKLAPTPSQTPLLPQPHSMSASQSCQAQARLLLLLLRCHGTIPASRPSLPLLGHRQPILRLQWSTLPLLPQWSTLRLPASRPSQALLLPEHYCQCPRAHVQRQGPHCASCGTQLAADMEPNVAGR